MKIIAGIIMFTIAFPVAAIRMVIEQAKYERSINGRNKTDN